MNYDLIIKLAKLANNNPNENEANSAARKVCKLLAEGNFNFTNNTTSPPKQPPFTNSNRPYTPPQNFWDLFNRVNQERKQKEQQHYEQEQRRRQEEQRQRTEQYYRPPPRTAGFEWNFYDFDFDFGFTKGPRTSQEPKKEPTQQDKWRNAKQYEKTYYNPLKQIVIVWCRNYLSKNEIPKHQFDNLGNNHYYCPNCVAK